MIITGGIGAPIGRGQKLSQRQGDDAIGRPIVRREDRADGLVPQVQRALQTLVARQVEQDAHQRLHVAAFGAGEEADAVLQADTHAAQEIDAGGLLDLEDDLAAVGQRHEVIGPQHFALAKLDDPIGDHPEPGPRGGQMHVQHRQRVRDGRVVLEAGGAHLPRPGGISVLQQGRARLGQQIHGRGAAPQPGPWQGVIEFVQDGRQFPREPLQLLDQAVQRVAGQTGGLAQLQTVGHPRDGNGLQQFEPRHVGQIMLKRLVQDI